ncbi:MAG: YIP1 family protein [Acidobacteriota bacterium]|nr:YIP1 family protein [Acidobacteriota bacterium]
MEGLNAIDAKPTEAGLTQDERVADTFVAPSKTFTDILRSTVWWLPFLLAVLMALCVTFTIDKKVGFERVVENTIHSSPKQEEQLSSLTPEQRAARVRSMAFGYRFTSYGSPLIILIFSAIGAVVLWGSFNFGLGAHTTFAQMFCLWMYCSLPRLISGLLTIITIAFGGNPESFDLKNPVGTNLGYYLPDAAPWLKAALGFFDLIGIWDVVLLILGTAIVAKVSRGKAAAVIVGWWVLLLIITIATTAAFR